LPNEVDFLFETSESGIVPELWGGKTTDENASLVRSLGKKKANNGSIVAKFKGQITRLVDTLDEVSVCVCVFWVCVVGYVVCLGMCAVCVWWDDG
jgi:hypothetical protein